MTPTPETAKAIGEMAELVADERFNTAASRLLVERAGLMQRLARYEAAEAEEALIQKELDKEHTKIMAKTKEEVVDDLIASGYSREELTEMAASTQLALNWYMSQPVEKRGWLFAFKAGRASALEPKKETS